MVKEEGDEDQNSEQEVIYVNAFFHGHKNGSGHLLGSSSFDAVLVFIWYKNKLEYVYEFHKLFANKSLIISKFIIFMEWSIIE